MQNEICNRSVWRVVICVCAKQQDFSTDRIEMNDTGFGEFFAQGIVILTLRTKHQQSFSRSFSCLIYVWPRQRFIAFRTIKIINNYIFPCNIKLSTTKYIFISCEFFENKYNTSLWHSIANGEKKCDQKKIESSGKSINHWCKKKSKIKQQQSKLPKKKKLFA